MVVYVELKVCVNQSNNYSLYKFTHHLKKKKNCTISSVFGIQFLSRPENAKKKLSLSLS